MHGYKNQILLGLTILLIVGFAASLPAGPKDKIHFNHDLHTEMDKDCSKCHAGVLTDKGIYRLLPDKPSCAECHDVKDKDQCGTCHSAPGDAKAPKKKARKTNFLHSSPKEHQGECSLCHKNLDTKPHKPGDHESCGQCHKEDIKNLLCAKCHRDMNFAGLNQMNRFKHENNFLKEHGSYAGKSVLTCTQCHTESYCTDCHGKKAGLKPSIKYPESVKRNFIHRGDYITLHRIEAKADNSSCLRCHAQKDCSACHKRSNVSPASKKGFYKHPPGWMSKASPNYHGEEARKNILSCASCHDGGGPGDCTTCHRASSGLNPHPKGFGKTRGMDTSNRMCAKCHGR